MTASHSDLVGSGAPRDPAGAWAKLALRHMLAETDRFITLVELVPSRGLVTDEAGRRVLALGRALAENSARFFHTGKVPGVVVTDELLALAERQDASPDRGRSFFHELAAKQIVIARGLGFRGAYIGGHLTATDYDEILERADAYGADDWSSLIRDVRFPQADEFHYFEEDAETGRSSVEVNREYAQSRARASGRRPIRGSLAYSFNRFMHGAMFEPSGRLHRIVRAVYHDCGDCSLPEIAYLCPESPCVKNQRNGPCGGTRDSICEIRREGVHLGSGLRAPQGVRPRGDDAGWTRSDPGQRAARNERVEQFPARARSPGQASRAA